MAKRPIHVKNWTAASCFMRAGISLKATQISPQPSLFLRRNSSMSSGGYSFVVTMVQSTESRKTTAPMVKAQTTTCGMACSAVGAVDTPHWPSHPGSSEAMTAPAPMKTLCMAKPTVRCSSGSRSATNARKGSMLTFTDASRIQSKPAAIHNTPECGMATRASEASMAPTRKYGRRRPSLFHVRSLM